MSYQRQPPEILAPVGTWEMCLAAVHNGADAIYLGMPGFNARGRAKTFSLDELKQIIDFCHLYGVRVFLAFNVLIFERELSDAAALLEEVIALGPDAFIVQDIGLVRLIKAIAPAQPVHGSTQMSVSSHEAIKFLRELEIKRFVLARELSLSEIERVRQNTAAEIEVFVHGALCVAYSGQCLTSESQGGRSANRGQCAQSCRLDYDLIVDGKVHEMRERRYLVSPKDLCGLDEIPHLSKIGVDSFKIEGRLKSPEYVASTVKSYRRKVDGAKLDSNQAMHQMKVSYSRDFFSGWLNGVDHQRLVDGRFSSHRGDQVGSISKIQGRLVVVDSHTELLAGDGALFVDFKSGQEIGGKIFKANKLEGSQYELSFLSEFPIQKLTEGMTLYINSSDKLSQQLTASFTDRERLKRIPIVAKIVGAVGKPLTLIFKDPEGREVSVLSQGLLEPASRAPLTKDFLLDEIGALGTTPFILKQLDFQIESDLFIHQREIKELRRSATQALMAKRQSRVQQETKPALTTLAGLRCQKAESAAPLKVEPELSVLIRERAQIEGLIGAKVDMVYLDFEFGKEYGPSLELLRSEGYKVGIATTRILKPGETAHLKVIDRLKPDAVLVRNLGALQFFLESGQHTLIGDFSLNIANSLSANWLLSRGLSRICPSYDLNREQLLELVENCSGAKIEVTLHQYMPTFHMEHCVFAAFLSSGSSFKDCGRPCELHRVELRDRNGTSHPLKPDAECRNTMFQGKPQSAARLFPELMARQVRNYRVEALFESAGELRQKIVAYKELLTGRYSSKDLFDRVGVVERYGITEGQLYNIRTWQDRKQAEERRM